MKLRDYQEAAVDSIFRYFYENNGNPIVAMPTGTGKSVVIGSFIQKACLLFPQTRVLKLTHVKELISQNFDKLIKLWPVAPAGIYSAGLKRKDANTKITFCGIASVYDKPEVFGHIDLVLIDECHLISPEKKTMYFKFLDALKKKNPYLKYVGFTATAFRNKQGKLTEGEGSLFDDVCFDLCNLECFNWLVDNGYLCRLIPKRTQTTLDISNVGTVGGEFNQNQLQEAVDVDAITRAALQETINSASERKHWLVFGSGVRHVVNITRILNEMGIKATCVHSKMKEEERDRNISDYVSGKYQAMVNNGILTTGFDFPAIDLIVMLRPTKSPGLWVQMLGRGTRPMYLPGYDLETPEGRLQAIMLSQKPNCLVLDFAGNTRQCGPINDPIIPKAKGKGGGGEAPIRECPMCGMLNHISKTECECCGYKFPRETKLTPFAATEELMVSEAPVVEWLDVRYMSCEPYRKLGSHDGVVIHYTCGLRIFKKFLLFNHPGPPSAYAKKFWIENVKTEIPANTAEALKRLNEIPQPKKIKVWLNKRYPEVLNYEY